MENELRDFWPGDQPIRVLADKWGYTRPYLSLLAKRMGLPSRYRRRNIRCISPKLSYFHAEARKRGITPTELRERLLQVIVQDRMVGAVLDDEDATLVPRAPARSLAS